jgi:hypothetical protein
MTNNNAVEPPYVHDCHYVDVSIVIFKVRGLQQVRLVIIK